MKLFGMELAKVRSTLSFMDDLKVFGNTVLETDEGIQLMWKDPSRFEHNERLLNNAFNLMLVRNKAILV